MTNIGELPGLGDSSIYENLTDLISAVLATAIYLMAKTIFPPTQICQLTILKVRLLVPLKY